MHIFGISLKITNKRIYQQLNYGSARYFTNALPLALIVMVGLAFQDGEGPVKLLGKKQAYHLVRECHF